MLRREGGGSAARMRAGALSRGGGGRPGQAARCRRASRAAGVEDVDRVRDHPGHRPAGHPGLHAVDAGPGQRQLERRRALPHHLPVAPQDDRGSRPARGRRRSRAEAPRASTVSPIVKRRPAASSTVNEKPSRRRERVEADVEAAGAQCREHGRAVGRGVARQRLGRAARDCAPGGRAPRTTGSAAQRVRVIASRLWASAPARPTTSRCGQERVPALESGSTRRRRRRAARSPGSGGRGAPSAAAAGRRAGRRCRRSAARGPTGPGSSKPVKRRSGAGRERVRGEGRRRRGGRTSSSASWPSPLKRNAGSRSRPDPEHVARRASTAPSPPAPARRRGSPRRASRRGCCGR